MKERTLKVRKVFREKAERDRTYYDTGYRTIPEIILMGDWLRDAGFTEEDRITVRCGKGRLTIRKQNEKE